MHSMRICAHGNMLTSVVASRFRVQAIQRGSYLSAVATDLEGRAERVVPALVEG
jgi:hypothetical protein